MYYDLLTDPQTIKTCLDQKSGDTFVTTTCKTSQNHVRLQEGLSLRLILQGKIKKAHHLVRNSDQSLLLEDVDEMSGDAELNELSGGELQMVVEHY